ncbi:MAG: hypothetical protein IKF90_21620 [Parasporobacterium sp.]|nr:hypothetical protein [Parasporobacterium sp.]
MKESLDSIDPKKLEQLDATMDLIEDEDLDPVWYDGKTIDEVMFCEDYLTRHPMKYIKEESEIEQEEVKQESNIPEEIKIEEENNIEAENDISQDTWITQMAVDEFGDVTEDSFPLLSAEFTGDFSNTATSSSELSVVISFAQNPGTKHYLAQVSLFEYESTKATYYSDDELILKTKLDDQIYEIKMVGEPPNGSFYIGTNQYDYNADWLFNELYLGNDLRCIINIGNSKYNFTMTSDNFKSICDAEQFLPAGDLENIMTPVDWETHYFDSEFMVLTDLVAPTEVYEETIVGNVITCWFVDGEDAHEAFDKYSRYLNENFESEWKSDGYYHYYDNRDNELYCSSLTNRSGTRIEITINKATERPEKSIDTNEAYKGADDITFVMSPTCNEQKAYVCAGKICSSQHFLIVLKERKAKGVMDSNKKSGIVPIRKQQ